MLLPILALFAASHGKHRPVKKTADDHVREAEGWEEPTDGELLDASLEVEKKLKGMDVMPGSLGRKVNVEFDHMLNKATITHYDPSQLEGLERNIRKAVAPRGRPDSNEDPYDNPIGRTLTAELLAAGKPVPDCAMVHVPAPPGALDKLGRSASKREGPEGSPQPTSPARRKAGASGPKVRTHPERGDR